MVGVVASAGGFKAFKAFFQAAQTSEMAFALILHLSPCHESALAALLGQHTRMAVRDARDGDRIEANHVYVIPPNRYLSVRRGQMWLTGPVDRTGPQTSIDFSLRSLAEDQRERAACVILSGTGPDGTLGLKSIKANGGVALVQEPSTADYDEMPRNAIASGLADYILPPEAMPGVLTDYARRIAATTPTAFEPRISDAELDKVINMLPSRAQLDFSPYRKRMVMRRLLRRMALARVARFEDYLDILHHSPDEVHRLVKDFLISVTNFFRDAEMFRLLETRVIPEIVRARSSGESIRVWVPGCATGEEAYSIAMIVFEQIAASGKNINLQVFATDVDLDALAVTRAGVYPDAIIADVGAERLGQFFVKGGDHAYLLSKRLRECVLFAQQNLLSDAPFSRLDLISCRNLLMYLDTPYQKKVLRLLRFGLNTGGYLVLGRSENIERAKAGFEVVSKKWRIYQRTVSASAQQAEFPIMAGLQTREWRAAGTGRSATPLPSWAQITQTTLLEDHAPAAVLVNEQHEVLHMSGPVDLYLRHLEGAPTRDITLLARGDLGVRVRSAVHRASREGRRVRLGGTSVARNRRLEPVIITARPLASPQGLGGLILVTFQSEFSTRPEKRGINARTNEARLVTQLERQLRRSRENVQTMTEELAHSNEELQTSNEELMSTNEELESTIEELQTSKEELLTLNEELASVNNQLQEKVDELESAHDDIANLLKSADIATVLLDSSALIRRFTAGAKQLFNLIESDIGRPLSDITPRFDDPQLSSDAARVMESLAPIDKDVRTEDGRYYSRRISPFRTAHNRVEGVVLAFVDVTANREATEQLRHFAEQLETRVAERTAELSAQILERERIEKENDAVLHTAAALIIVRDPSGCILRFNRACEMVTGYSAEEVRGKVAFDWFDSKDDAALVNSAYAQIRGKVRPLSYENRWRHRDGSERTISWSLTGIFDRSGTLLCTVKVGIDVTEERRIQLVAAQRQQALMHMYRVHTAGGLAAALAHELNQPLTAAVAYCETSLANLRRGLGGEDLIGQLENAVAQAHRASNIIRGLRGFLMKSSGEKAALELRPIVEAVRDLIEPQARAARVDVKVALARALPRVMAGRVQLEQVLVNLVKNGIEAIVAAGRPAGHVTISARPGDNTDILITVTDDGPGVSAEDMKRMFDPFYSTKTEGLGMGLAICRSIVEAYGGQLWIDPAENAGCALHFTIPAEVPSTA